MQSSIRLLIYLSDDDIAQFRSCCTVTPVMTMTPVYHVPLRAVYSSPKKGLSQRKCNFFPTWILYILVQQSKNCVSVALVTHYISVFVFSEVWQAVFRTCQGVYFSLFWASGVDVCFFLSTVWTVSHTCQAHPCMNGRLGSHSLNQPPVAFACVDVCLCGSM